MSWFRRHISNYITGLRILGAVCLLFTQPFSAAFYGIYTLCGISDVLDGWLARRMGIVSEFGAKLDSVADLMFYGGMLVKVFPVLWELLPVELWVSVGVVLAVRLCAYGVAAVKYRCFASLHTYMNKLTGAAVFAMPYLIGSSFAVPYCWGACVVAALASAEELLIHWTAEEYHANVKTVFMNTTGCPKGEGDV